MASFATSSLILIAVLCSHHSDGQRRTRAQFKVDISTVTKDALTKYVEYDILPMYDLRIREIQNCAFSEMKRMVELDLSKNLLTTIGKDTFYATEILEILLLNDNKISQIDSTAFRMPALLKLDLSGNKLVSFPAPLFKGTNKLKILRMGWNPMKMTESFNIPHSLEEFEFIPYQIMTLDSFGGFPNLETLRLLGGDTLSFDWPKKPVASLKTLVLTPKSGFNEKDIQDICDKVQLYPNLERLKLNVVNSKGETEIRNYRLPAAQAAAPAAGRNHQSQGQYSQYQDQRQRTQGAAPSAPNFRHDQRRTQNEEYYHPNTQRQHPPRAQGMPRRRADPDTYRPREVAATPANYPQVYRPQYYDHYETQPSNYYTVRRTDRQQRPTRQYRG